MQEKNRNMKKFDVYIPVNSETTAEPPNNNIAVTIQLVSNPKNK